MAILANVHFRGVNIKSAYVKIRKKWGNDVHGWCCIMGVAADAELAAKGIWLYEFSLGPIQGEPYAALYKAASDKFVTEGIEHLHDHEVAVEAQKELEVPPLNADIPKKTRKKKDVLSSSKKQNKNG